MFFEKARALMPGILFLFFLLSGTLVAVPGDCNGDGTLSISDIIAVVDYLRMVGPLPVNPEDCDCDGHQGITYADALQIIEYGFGTAQLYAAWGDDYARPCGVEFYFNEKIDFGAQHTIDTMEFYVRVPDDFTVHALTIPFSYAAENGQMEVSCTGTDLTGSVGAGLSAVPDNTKKIILLMGNPSTFPIALAPGSEGLLFKAFFTQDSNGDRNDVRMSSYNRYWPLILAKAAYDGVNGERVFTPAVIRARYGDANCDGRVNISDAVVIINYVFLNGPAPGECEH